MRRREFLVLLSSGVLARATPAAAQSTRAPVVGFLNLASPNTFGAFLAAFHQGLSDRGYVEGKNVTLEYRWAGGNTNKLQQDAADLVRRQVAAIVATGGTLSAQAAKAATSTIPIVFVVGNDPVGEKLVSSINRPSTNATGVALVSTDLIKKRLQLLRELLPNARKIALLFNPHTPSGESERVDAETVAQAGGFQLIIAEASNEAQLANAFETMGKAGADALLVTADSLYTSRRTQLVALAAAYKLPTAYPWREYAEAGGLMSYGPNIADAYRQAGDYVGHVLAGAKPEDLPVRLPTTFDLVLNRKTAKALGIEVPYQLLVLANEVIE
jgi:putative ABC transport system substrate-binding protein